MFKLLFFVIKDTLICKNKIYKILNITLILVYKTLHATIRYNTHMYLCIYIYIYIYTHINYYLVNILYIIVSIWFLTF